MSDSYLDAKKKDYWCWEERQSRYHISSGFLSNVIIMDLCTWYLNIKKSWNFPFYMTGEPFHDRKVVPYDRKYHEEWTIINAQEYEKSRPHNFYFYILEMFSPPPPCAFSTCQSTYCDGCVRRYYIFNLFVVFIFLISIFFKCIVCIPIRKLNS